MSKPPKHSGWSVGNTNPRKRGLWKWQGLPKPPAKKGCALMVLASLTLTGLVGMTSVLGGLWMLVK